MTQFAASAGTSRISWPRKPHHGLSLVPPRSALWMNWRGERIGPQPLVNGFDTRDLVTNICRHERQYSWQIMNRKIALKELAVSGAEFNHSLREKKRFTFMRDILIGNWQLLDDMIAHCEDFVGMASGMRRSMLGNPGATPALKNFKLRRCCNRCLTNGRVMHDRQAEHFAYHLRSASR